jgi:murein DD-endopeptidase MepM/ murein hydrolase activator NlpD
LRLAGAAVAALAFAAPARAHTDAVWQLSFVWPASGLVSRGFGWDGPAWHPGIDIGSLRSLDVRAAAPGVVEDAGFEGGFKGYGKIVLVDVGGGYEALFAHLSKVEVKPGEQVETGQMLGLAGCTGRCHGTHLHFEVRWHGTAIDPTLLMPAGVPDAQARWFP